jgi:hypothetical protein
VVTHWVLDFINADFVPAVSPLASPSRCHQPRQPRRLPLRNPSSLQRMVVLSVARKLLNSADSAKRHVTAPQNVNKQTRTFTSFSAAATRISRFDQARIHDLLFSFITRRRSLSSSGLSVQRTSRAKRMSLIMSRRSLAASLLGPSTLAWTGHLGILSEI